MKRRVKKNFILITLVVILFLTVIFSSHFPRKSVDNFEDQSDVVTLDNYHYNKPYKFFLYPKKKCIISDIIRENNIWEKYMHDVFEKYVTKNSIVLEGGCHIGTHSIKLSCLCKHLIAYEPMTSSYDLLIKNVEINRIQNIDVIKKGLSDKKGKAHFDWIPESNPSGSGLSNNPLGTPSGSKKIDKIDVELTTIDSLNLEKLDFIKLDIEGYEPLAIKGGINTIKRCKPVITMEIWKNHKGDYDIENTKNSFKNLIDIGYTVEHILGPDYLFIPPK